MITELRLACSADARHSLFAAQRRVRLREYVLVDARGSCLEILAVADREETLDAFASPTTCAECNSRCVLTAVRIP